MPDPALPTTRPVRRSRRTGSRRAPIFRTEDSRTERQISAEIEALEGLSHAELKERWTELYGNPPPAHAKKIFLLRAIAYRIQEEAFGGLDARTRRQLAKIAHDLAAGRKPKTLPAQTAAGTRLIREWKGEIYEVVVLKNGVQYRGETWPSLSAVAREITGTRWSGPRFFGLRSPRRHGHR